MYVVVLFQSLSHVWLFWTPWAAARQASLSFTISRSLLKFMSIELVMPSSHFLLCHPLLLPSVFPSIRVFSNESTVHIRWPKYWCFSISPSNEYSGLIYFRIDWFDLLAVQRTLNRLSTYILMYLSLQTLSSFHFYFTVYTLCKRYSIPHFWLIVLLIWCPGINLILYVNTHAHTYIF